MALGGQQQVGEPAEHVGADRLAFIGAGHAADLVGRDAEMVGPEPDQPLDKSDLGAERGRDATARFFEIDRPARIGDGFGGHLFRRLARSLPGSFHHRRRVRHLLALRVLFFLRDDRLGLPAGHTRRSPRETPWRSTADRPRRVHRSRDDRVRRSARRAGRPRSPRSIPDAAPSRTGGGPARLRPLQNGSWQHPTMRHPVVLRIVALKNRRCKPRLSTPRSAFEMRVQSVGSAERSVPTILQLA